MWYISKDIYNSFKNAVHVTNACKLAYLMIMVIVYDFPIEHYLQFYQQVA